MSDSEEPLHLCPADKWSELEDIFKADWPRSIAASMVIDTQKYMLQCGLDHGFKMYCPYGKGSNGIVAINIKKGLYELILQCPCDDTSKLEESLLKTSIIDWDTEIEIPFVPHHVTDCIRRVIDRKNMVFTSLVPAITYILDKSSPLFNVTLPPGLSVDFLSFEHIDMLDSTWPHRFDGCNIYFELIIKAKLGFGLFKENKLVSWVLRRETGPLLHLYTLPEERRKGYGEMVLKLVSNLLLKEGKRIVAYCKKDNINAAKLYQKLHFQHISDVDWCTIKRK